MNVPADVININEIERIVKYQVESCPDMVVEHLVVINIIIKNTKVINNVRGGEWVIIASFRNLMSLLGSVGDFGLI